MLLVRVRKSQLQIAEEEGKSGAKAAPLVANNVEMRIFPHVSWG